MVFLKAVLGSAKILVTVGFMVLLLGLVGVNPWPAFESNWENWAGLFLFGMTLWLFAFY